MIKLLCLLSCLVGFSIWARTQVADRESALLSMIETERAFARMSGEKGTQPSFLAFIADDGILFRPKAVKGKQWMLDHPAPVSNKRSLLSWGPSYADVASSGDMGYTFGPWQFKSDINEARPVAWGHFVTVWKKQSDGTWKFAVDLGVSHPEPSTSTYELEKSNKGSSPRAGVASATSAREILHAAEQKFSEESLAKGARAAFVARADSEVRVFRENKFPLSGVTAAAEFIPTSAGLWSWQPEGWDVSRSGDLGYSYGSYRLASADPKFPAESGNYFRIWKKQGDVWKVVVDVANPVPEKAN
ncbi:MAG TPA: nuclear transport factor 2 family protein [Pyrinomonadaceae bacterium]|nr:nuclear transport factor 2 family protein [Pyrinomonadaceae bacterium]